MNWQIRQESSVDPIPFARSAKSILQVCLVLTLAGRTASGLDGAYRRLDVVGPRALESALQVLENSFSCIVTFEEPAYDYEGNTQVLFPNGPRIPRIRKLTFDYSASDKPEQAIEALLKEYHHQDATDRFKMVHDTKYPHIFNVLPLERRNPNGDLIPAQSLLEKAISFQSPETKLTQEILETICNLASVTSGHKLRGVGFSGGPIRSTEPFSVVASNVPALAALNDLVFKYNATNQNKISWSIRRNPESDFTLLNLHWLNPTGEPLVVSVEDARPLATAAMILEDNLNCTITYEDPELICPCDLLLDAKRTPQIPRGGRIALAYSPDADRVEIIRSLLKKSNVGVFTLTGVSPNVYSIYPAQTRDQDGRLRPVRSLSVISIDIDGSSAAAAEILAGICKDLSQKAEKKVNLGVIPAVLKSDAKINYQAKNKAFNGAVTDYLKAFDDQLSWQLLYDPKTKTYNLNIHEIGK